jgi:protein SCO1/2
MKRILLASTLSVALAPTAALARPASSAPPSRAVRVDEQLGRRLPLDLVFTTSAGRKVRLGDVLGAGRPTLLVLAYSRCSALCNLVLRGAADFVREFDWKPGERFTVLTVSINPEETPHEAARTQQSVLAYAGYAGEPARWPFLVGNAPEVRSLADSLGFRYFWDARTRQYAHPAATFVISERGDISEYFYGLRLEPEAVRAALLGAGATAANQTGLAAAALACFRFDATGRRYGPVIQRSFQLGSAAVFLALLVGLTRLAWRGRAR